MSPQSRAMQTPRMQCHAQSAPTPQSLPLLVSLYSADRPLTFVVLVKDLFDGHCGAHLHSPLQHPHPPQDMVDCPNSRGVGNASADTGSHAQVTFHTCGHPASLLFLPCTLDRRIRNVNVVWTCFSCLLNILSHVLSSPSIQHVPLFRFICRFLVAAFRIISGLPVRVLYSLSLCLCLVVCVVLHASSLCLKHTVHCTGPAGAAPPHKLHVRARADLPIDPPPLPANGSRQIRLDVGSRTHIPEPRNPKWGRGESNFSNDRESFRNPWTE
jgi:hypothetical protein